MKKFNFYFLLSLLSFAFIMVSCGDDEEEGTNEITITIQEPTDGEVIADCADVHVHIDFDATVENHEIEILLHREGDVNDVALEYDEHDHDKSITFEQDVNLCDYPAGTCFHLEVAACVDHDCEEKTTAEAEFCLQ